MKNKKLLVSTLVAAAATTFSAVPAFAAADAFAVPTETGPWSYSTADYDSLTESNFQNTTNCYFSKGDYSKTYTVGNGENTGVLITNGFSNGTTNFEGEVKGAGDFIVLWGGGSDTEDEPTTYNFSKVSGFSGKFVVKIINGGINVLKFSATDQTHAGAIAGTGSISSNSRVEFNTAGYKNGDQTVAAATIKNTEITAKRLTFTGGAKYTVGAENVATQISVSEGGTLIISGKSSLDFTNSSTLSIGSNATFSYDVTGMTKTDNKYVLINGATLGDSFDSLTKTAVGNSARGRRQLVNDTTNNRVYVIAEADLTWAGTSGNNAWTVQDDATETPSGGSAWSGAYDGVNVFKSADNVTFGTNAAEKNVAIAQSITAGTVAVQDNYKFEFSGTDTTVTADSLAIANGKKLELSGTGTLESTGNYYNFAYSGSNVANKGEISVGAGTTLKFSGSANATFHAGNIKTNITGAGTLVVEGQWGLYLPEFEGTVKFESGVVRFGWSNNRLTGIYNSKATIDLANGVNLALTGNMSTTANGVTTDSPLSAKIVLNGTHDLETDYTNKGNTTAYTGTFAGEISGANATLNKTGTGTVNFTGNVAVKNITTSGGTVNFTGTLNSTEKNAINLALKADNITVKFGGGTAEAPKNFTLNQINSTAANGNNKKIEVAQNVNLSAKSFTANYILGEFKVDGKLDVEGTMKYSTGAGTNKITGTGTVSVNKFELVNQGDSEISVSRFEIGSEGIVKSKLHDTQSAWNKTLTLNGTTLAVKSNAAARNGGNNGWSSDVAMKLGADGAKFDPKNAETISLSGVLSGTGALEKIGAGTLELSGANTFTGGVTISKGMLVAANASALGAGTDGASVSVKIENGAQLEVKGVTLNAAAISIVLNDAYKIVDGSIAAAAITGTSGETDGSVALGAGTTIVLSLEPENADARAVATLAQTAIEREMKYQILDSTLAGSLTIDAISLAADLQSKWEVSGYENGVVTLSQVPEPSAFGLLAGLGALALVASRRRRSRKA